MKQMNKKGDIPIVILVIGVVMICGLAILSFVKPFTPKNKFDVELFEDCHADLAKFQFYTSPEIGLSKEAAAEKISDLTFDKINNKVIIEKKGEVVSIRYEVPLG